MKRGGPEGLRLVSSGREALSQFGHTLVVAFDECGLVLRKQRRVHRLKMIPDPRHGGHVLAVCIFHAGMMPRAPGAVQCWLMAAPSRSHPRRIGTSAVRVRRGYLRQVVGAGLLGDVLHAN